MDNIKKDYTTLVTNNSILFECGKMIIILFKFTI